MAVLNKGRVASCSSPAAGAYSWRKRSAQIDAGRQIRKSMIEGLTQTQFAALAKLYEVGPCSQNHLGRLIYLDAATIKGVVDRLHLRGFVTALNDLKDRRRRAVALTDRGRQVTEAAMRVAVEITAATLAPLTADEQRQISKLLRKLG